MTPKDPIQLAKKHNLELFEVTAKEPEKLDLVMKEMGKIDEID